MGKLGRDRAFALCPIANNFRLPTDLAGINLFRYEHALVKNNPQELRSTLYKIKQVIKKTGPEKSKIPTKIPVGFVMNKVLRFHNEIMHGTIFEFEKHRIYPEVQEFSFADKNSYHLSLRNALRSEIECIIVVPPCENTDITELNELIEQKRCVVFMENPPLNISNNKSNSYITIESDSEAGAQYLATYVSRRLKSKDKSVLLLNGPNESKNAKQRKKIFENTLQEHIVESITLDSWAVEDAIPALEKLISENENANIPEFIVCCNDVVGLGVCQWLQKRIRATEQYPRVVGYDGILKAIIAIADDENPFEATIAIPPSGYGRMAAQIIIDLFEGKKINNFGSIKKIDITRENLLLNDEAKRLVENERWIITH
jgi:ABC-type sugar transport system substrate-binding protein